LVACDSNYKIGCSVAERDPSEVHYSEIDSDYKFSPDSNWCKIIEFYCPHCGVMIENEYLPLGHPITHDIDIDIGQLRKKVSGNSHNLRVKP
jgi:acetophenone carboxylase